MFAISSFGGVKIVVSGNAVDRVTNWPIKSRSRRLHNKMTKKRGPQFTEKPGAWMMADGRLICHPKLYNAIKARIAKGGAE